MRLLLDTHILLACVQRTTADLPKPMAAALEASPNTVWASVLSLWEVAIKWRAGKLPLTVGLAEWPDGLRMLGFEVLPVCAEHVLANIGPEPSHKDPFDRLFLGICAAEGMKLVTLDRALAEHPLAWRDIPSVKK